MAGRPWFAVRLWGDLVEEAGPQDLICAAIIVKTNRQVKQNRVGWKGLRFRGLHDRDAGRRSKLRVDEISPGSRSLEMAPAAGRQPGPLSYRCGRVQPFDPGVSTDRTIEAAKRAGERVCALGRQMQAEDGVKDAVKLIEGHMRCATDTA